MGNFQDLGKLLVVAGVALAVLGGLVWVVSRFVNLDNLPGTLRIQGSGFTCVVPVLASIIGSVVLTILLNVILRFLRK